MADEIVHSYGKYFATANATWEVFHTAEKNMDQIRLYLDTVPTHITGAINMIMSASNEELEENLQLPLSAMRNVTDKCLTRAQKTEEGIYAVMKLIGELQEACTGTKGHYERQLTKARCNRDVLEAETKQIEYEKEVISTQYEQIRDTICTAEKEFAEAITDAPGSLSVAGMQIAGGLSTAAKVAGQCLPIVAQMQNMQIVDGIITSTNIVMKFVAMPKQLSREVNQTQPSSQSAPPDKPINENDMMAYKEAIDLESIIRGFAQSINKVYNVSQIPIKNIYTYRAKFGSMNDKLSLLGDCPVKEKLKQLCSRGIEICDQIEKILSNFCSETGLPKSVSDSIKTLQTDVNDIVSKGQDLMDACPDKQARNRESWQITDYIDDGVVKTHLENAKLKVKLSCENLRKAQLSHDKLSKDFVEKSERLAKVLGDVAKLDLEHIDFEEILEVLGQGLVELGHLRRSWGKAVHFYQSLSNILSCSMDVSLNKFIGVSENTRKHAVQGYELTHLKRDMLYQQVTCVSQIANFVSHIAETYCEVSKQNIMPAMNSAPAILKLNPDTQKMAIKHMMESLQLDCKTAQEEIGILVSKKTLEFDSLVKKRILNIQSQMRHLDMSMTEPRPSIEDATNLHSEEDIDQYIDEFV